MEKEALKNGDLTNWNNYWTALGSNCTIWSPRYAEKQLGYHLERRFPSLELNLKQHY